MQAGEFWILLVLVPIFFLIWHRLKQSMGKQRALHGLWRVFAEGKGLRERDAESGVMLSFHGENQGFPFVLECFATEGTPTQIGKLKMSRGDGIKIFTRMKIVLPGLPKGLRIYRESAWGKLGKAIGLQDISTGDTVFDGNFIVKGDAPEEVLNYLIPSRRMALLAYAEKLPGLELTGEGILLLKRDQTDTLEDLERDFTELGSLASTLHASVAGR